MRNHVALPSSSLRTKLVLSYLGVALGAIFILSIVITQVVQFNFAHQQQGMFNQNEESKAQQLGVTYHNYQDDWHNVPSNLLNPPDPWANQSSNPDNSSISVVIDSNKSVYNVDPRFAYSLGTNSTIYQCIDKALHGTLTENQVQWQERDVQSFAVYYACEPIHDNGQPGTQVVGMLFAMTPVQYSNASISSHFLKSVDLAILITGLAIALIVIIFSLFLARGLTKPLKSLTTAVERMQSGDYTQRVEPPNSQDEIGHLSHAFNAMAGTIETDVTELRRQDELRRDLIANIAHDLATPLTSVQGFSEALADDVITNAQARQETAQLIGREVQRLRRLVSDIQNMTSLEAGRLHLDLAPLDLYTLVNETLDVVGFECEQVGIMVRNEMSPGMPLVLADSDRITQVLLNLVDNARRHTPAGGTITIGATPEEQRLTVWISDTGTGINPADLPHIFERFYRADRSRTTTTGGSGLGLAIVKAIITAHNGTIRAESQPGRGTRITFTLPLAR